jgi:hypothetical protein
MTGHRNGGDAPMDYEVDPLETIRSAYTLALELRDETQKVRGAVREIEGAVVEIRDAVPSDSLVEDVVARSAWEPLLQVRGRLELVDALIDDLGSLLRDVVELADADAVD